jgi:hypothetical protein
MSASLVGWVMCIRDRTRPAPASRAAMIGQATIGRPQTGWRTLGTDECIRVPWPAAMISAVGAAAFTHES